VGRLQLRGRLRGEKGKRIYGVTDQHRQGALFGRMRWIFGVERLVALFLVWFCEACVDYLNINAHFYSPLQN